MELSWYNELKVSERLTPLEQAEQEIPPAWFEKFGYRFNYIITASSVASLLLYDHFITAISLETAISGGGLFLVGTIADRLSTIEVLRAANRSAALGIEDIYAESNLALRSIKTPQDFIRNPIIYAIDAGGLAVSALNPAAAVSLSAFKGIATLNNLRIAKRLTRAAEIAELS